MGKELSNILNKILKEESEKITTKKTSEDPETGKIEWDVEYENSIDKSYQEFDKFLDGFQDVVGSSVSHDQILDDLQSELLDIKSRLHTYILRKRKNKINEEL